MDSSKFLIVICSPRAAQSEWVCKEVQDFIDSGREEYIIPFIIDGEPYSKNPEIECYPKTLKALAGEKELLGININENGRDSAAVKVIARMFDVRFDSLWQRFRKSERKRRTTISLIIAFIVLLLMSLSYSFVRYKNSQQEIKMLNLNNSISEAETLSSQDKPLSAAHLLLSLINENRALSDEETNLLNVAIQNCTEKLVNSKCELIGVSKVINKETSMPKSSRSNCNYVFTHNEDDLYLFSKKKNDTVIIGNINDYPHPSNNWLSTDGNFLFLPSERDCLEGGVVNVYDLTNALVKYKINVKGSWYAEGNVLSIKPDNSKFLYHYGFRGESGIIEYGIDGKYKNLYTEYEKGDNVEALSAEYSPSGSLILLYERENDKNPIISIIDASSFDIVYTFDDLDFIKLKNIYWDKTCESDVVCMEDTLLAKTVLKYSWKINRDSKTIPQNKTLQSMCISNDGTLIAYSTIGDSVFIYNTQKSQITHKGKHNAYSMNFNNQGNYLCFVDAFGQTAELYNVFNKMIDNYLPIELSYNNNYHTGIVFSKDDETIIFKIGAVWGGISVWDLPNCKDIQTDLTGDSILFNNDYSKMISRGESDSDIFEFDFKTREKKKIQNYELSNYLLYEDNLDIKLSNNKLFYIRKSSDNNLKYGSNITSDSFFDLFDILVD